MRAPGYRVAPLVVVLALVALVLHRVTDSAVPDALATIVIGLMLGFVALRLTRRNRQLLSNQGIPQRYVDQLRAQIGAASGVRDVTRLEAIYLGPREVLVAVDVQMDPDLSGPALVAALDRIRAGAERDVPMITRLYLTPVPAD